MHEVRLWATTVLFAAAVTLLPLAGASERLIHPGPWFAFVTGCLLLLTQPRIGPREMLASARDRLTALCIFAAQIGSVLFAIVEYGYRPEWRPAAVSPWTVGGIALAGSALAFRIWAIRTLGRFFTATVQVATDHRVVSNGPYRLLRHPSYTGALLTPIGVSLALQSGLGVGVVLLAGIPAYLYRIRVEERALGEELGPPYEDYRRRTWRLIPFVH